MDVREAVKGGGWLSKIRSSGGCSAISDILTRLAQNPLTVRICGCRRRLTARLSPKFPLFSPTNPRPHPCAVIPRIPIILPGRCSGGR
jgi:hypothetical protein